MSFTTQSTSQQEPLQRQLSFIGLPPISPGPNFGSALGITAADFSIDDAGRDTRDQRPASPHVPVPRQIPSPHPRLDHSADTDSSHSNDNRAGSLASGAFHSQSSPRMNNYTTQVTSAYRPSQDQAMHGAYAAMLSSQAQQPVGQPYQNGAQYAVNGNGFPQQHGQPSSQYAVQNGVQQYASNGNGMQQHGQPSSQYAAQNGQPGMTAQPSYQQFATLPGAPPGMSSPSLQSNGTFVLPPGWKVEQSQLQQPLSSPRHRASPSISSLRQPKDTYEIDKETGALSTRSVSPPAHSPIDMRRLDQAAGGRSMGESSQQGYAPPNPPFAQGQSSALGRVSTNSTQGSHGQEERDGKRNSNMFSSIRSRLGGGNGQQGFDPTKSVFTADDGVSEASVRTEEQARKGPGNFFGLRGNGQPASEGRASYDTNPNTSAFSPPERTRTFFPNGSSPSTQDLSQLSRPATMEGVTSPPPVGFGNGPKKRFSKLTGMLNRDKSEAQLSQPQGFNPMQTAIGRPSLTGQRPYPGVQMGPPGGPGGNDQMSAYGRPRSATNESRPSIGDQGRNPSAQGLMSPPSMVSIPEDDRGRKVSAGNILSNIFGKRSESKTRDQQIQSSPAGLGQPQGMMPQGQTPPRPGHPGQFPSFLAHSLGMPGQPVIPPQGRYAGLAQQVQIQQAQQQHMLSQQQQLAPGMATDRFNNYLQGGPSPGVSPITQSSVSPFTTRPPGSNGEIRSGVAQQGMQGPSPQQGSQDPRSPIGSVQIATAVPIRQVERSPNSSSGQFSGQDSPQSDFARGRSASFVNQIEIGGPKRPNLDAQGRNRSASSAIPQQHPVHIASLQAPVRKPLNSSSPRNSAHLGPQDSSSIDAERQQSVGQQSTQASPSTRRVSQNLSAVSQNASQLTPSTSPAPSQEQQSGPPNVPPKTSDHPLDEDQMEQGIPSLTSPQNSVYRPSGPQLGAAVQHFVQPQRQWGAADRDPADSQNAPSRPGQPGQFAQHAAQYSMQGRPPQDMTMTAPPQEQRPDKDSTFARMLKTSKTFVQEKTASNEKSKGDKESRSAKILGAFSKKPKQTGVTSPPPFQAPPGGPAWGPAPTQSQGPPKLYEDQQVAQTVKPTQHLVTQGLQQMPSKAQQLLGQPPNAMYQAPLDQPPGKARPSSERTNSQPYLNYQDERQAPGKTTPPLSPDQVQGASPAQQAPQPAQPSSGRPSISSLPPSQGQQRLPSHQPQQQPVQSSAHNPMSAIAQAKGRAHNLKQQIAPHGSGQYSSEPQYATVPIPQGYSAVYGGQTVNLAPATTPAYAQALPGMPGMPYQRPPQQWVHPALMQGSVPGQVPPGMPPGMGPGMPPQGMPPQTAQGGYQQYPPYQQGTPPPMMMAPHQVPQQQYMPEQHATPSPPVQGQMSPPGVSTQQPMQQPMQQSVQQSGQQPAQQYMHQPMSQPGWQQPVAAPVSGQSQQVQMAPQQTSTPPQPTSPAYPQRANAVPSEVAQPTPANAVPPVSQAEQHFSVVPDVVTASSAQMTNGDQSHVNQPAPVDFQPSPTPQQTVPRSAFAVQSHSEQNQLQPPQGSNENLMPQRQTSAASQVSSITTEAATSKGSPDIQRVQVVHPVHTPEPMQPASPERQRGVTLRDEPLPKVDTPVTATPADREDIYGATPRQSVKASPVVAEEQNLVEHIIVSGPAQESNIEPDSKFAGMPVDAKPEFKVEPFSQQTFIVDAPPVIVEPKAMTPSPAATSPSPSPALAVRSKLPLPEDEPPSPTESELKLDEANKTGQDAFNSDKIVALGGKPVQSSQEIFDEHKRRQLIRDMEEKIALMPEPDMLEPTKKKKEDEVPMMSATSYPGQEWNPYGAGFESDDE